MRTRWIKVLSDLWSNRTRTLIVALAVAVGVYAVGGVLAAQTLMLREYHLDQEQAHAASAIIYTTPFDSAFTERITQIPIVAAAEGRTSTSIRVLAGDGTWQEVILIAVDDFETMTVDKFMLVDGRFPTQNNDLMLEWMGLPFIGSEIGQTVTVELTDGTQKELTITGTAHHSQYPSPEILGFTFGFVSPETMQKLGLLDQFTELHLIAAGDNPDSEAVQSMVAQVEDQIEQSGRQLLGTTIIGESIIESIINTVVLILSSFGWVILFLSGFLVINTISALIAQQMQQIGIMKLVGASRLQMMAMYITMVVVYGTLAFSIGIPLAVATARYLMVSLVEPLVNIRVDSYVIPAWVYAVMIGVGVLIPLIAGMLPVWQGTRITTHKALNDVGMAGGGGEDGFIDRVLRRLPRKMVQRPLILAIRNTLRHKSRLFRTLFVMIFGTALFIAVISVRISVNTTQADFLRYHQYDVGVDLERPYRTAPLEQTLLALPDVVAVESWAVDGATRLRPDGSESNRYQVYGLPENTDFVDPVVQNGRWLRPDDHNSIVINASVLNEENDIQIGDSIQLDIGGREQSWEVVGIVGTDAQGENIYMNYHTYAYEMRAPGRTNSVQVITTHHDAAFQTEMETIIFNHLEASGFDVSSTTTTQTLNAQNGLMFDVIIAFLIFMAVLLAGVGSLGLSTTMGINMLERIREIGVLRAIGASNSSIRQIVLLEGVVIGLISWTIGVLFSFPIARFMSEQIGIALLKMPLTYTYATWAAIIWFFVLMGLAVAASLGPARNAVKLTIREVLAYE
ncbi:MAG: ABC transporter permease [Chloroflexi bacterium]|nr:ABC transporter permease [Chloroflexota bacterium]